MGTLRWLSFLLVAGLLLLGASGVLPPALSTLLWLAAAILFACHPSSPVLRAVGGLVSQESRRPPPTRR